jgi:hypothetical protein
LRVCSSTLVKNNLSRSVSFSGSGVLQRACACGQHSGGGECESCKRKRMSLQRMAVDRSAPDIAPPIVHDVLHSSGQPLDDSTRGLMESRFGQDFSRVRVHTDPSAARSAQMVNARAFTVGQHLVFGAGQFNKHTPPGQRLLLHEMTHVVQQGNQNLDAPGNLRVGEVNDRYEQEAQTISQALSNTATPEQAPVSFLQRSPNPVLMRSPLFNSTMEICHRLLRSREFEVTEGGLQVIANGTWEASDEWAGSEPPRCGNPVYHMTLEEVGWLWNSGYGTCEFQMGETMTRIWNDLPSDTYRLTIWTNNTNPNCCLRGNIEVSQGSGFSGSSCTQPPPGPLEMLHGALDVAGLIPVLGAVPDAINAGIYLIEGDWTNAGLSAVAIIPIFGDAATVAKVGTRTVVRVTGEGIQRVGREGIEAGLREARSGQRVATRAAEGSSQTARRIDSEVDEMVERGIVEEASTTTRPSSRPRPAPPAVRGQAAAAREAFEGVRDGYARRLGVGRGGQVHHAVELQALDRYPGVFSASELNDFRNMRGIATELAERRQLHNSKVREVWDRHYRQLDQNIAERGLRPGTQAYNDYVRRYVESARDEIDYVLGQFFTEYRSGLNWQRISP